MKFIKKINLIYGQNGSGKSTIANYFNPDDSKAYKECNSNLDNTYNYLVYNKNSLRITFIKATSNQEYLF
ncbi:AAA family ATPase [Xenorhabdus sp. NBAII XenSa04]|uniref:AAA family ATPase n=1 Tax=Xenorhabdus TaxID=626 RepID=UPI000907C8FA